MLVYFTALCSDRKIDKIAIFSDFSNNPFVEMIGRHNININKYLFGMNNNKNVNI